MVNYIYHTLNLTLHRHIFGLLISLPHVIFNSCGLTLISEAQCHISTVLFVTVYVCDFLYVENVVLIIFPTKGLSNRFFFKFDTILMGHL